MDDSLKLNWKIRYEWYPNERYLKGYDNLLSAYLPKKQGRIPDTSVLLVWSVTSIKPLPRSLDMMIA